MEQFRDFVKRFEGIFSLLFSRKFVITIVGGASVIYGLKITEWQKALLTTIFVVGLVLSIAIEDAARKNASGGDITIEWDEAPNEAPVE